MVADPYRSYHFTLEIAGVAAGGFVEASGIGAEIEVIPYRETGTATAAVRSLPGRVTLMPLTLRYGVSMDRGLWDWFNAVQKGQLERRNVSVIQFQNDGVTESHRWNLYGAWPNAFVAGQLTTRQSEIAIESLTLVYDRLERD